jgi:hypothetical protein
MQASTSIYFPATYHCVGADAASSNDITLLGIHGKRGNSFAAHCDGSTGMAFQASLFT